MINDLNHLECITLFAEDLSSAREFYLKTFNAELFFEDSVCVVIKLQNVMINLLNISEAPGLVAPLQVASSEVGSRLMFTIKVKNVDEVCTQLKAHGIKLINGPIDRPWGRRTAVFRDPTGQAWEIAQEL